MTDNPDNPDKPEDHHDTDTDASAPTGAIFVTTFLTVVILVFWFGVYILNVVRG